MGDSAMDDLRAILDRLTSEQRAEVLRILREYGYGADGNNQGTAAALFGIPLLVIALAVVVGIVLALAIVELIMRLAKP